MLKIAHLADLHIRNLTRHQEYKIILDRLYHSLTQQKLDFIVFAGDLFHQKTQMSPEGIQLASEFLKNLSNIAYTIVIPGNHDINIHNTERLDAISPIINLLKNTNQKLSYIYQTNILTFNSFNNRNINFYIHSQIDNNKKFDWTENNEKINICLFHGVVDGAKTDVGFSFEDSNYNLEYFKKFDFCLLGDIHKRQTIDKEGRIRYSGSIIQQDFGESIYKHGYLVWEIDDKKEFNVQEIDIPSEYGYYIVKTKNGKILDLDSFHRMPKYANVRIDLDVQPTLEEENNWRTILPNTNWNIELNIVDPEILTNEPISTGLNINYYDVNIQNKVISEYFSKDNILTILPEDLEQLHLLNCDINSKVKIKEQVSRNKKVELVKLKIKNLFSFGDEEQVIEFNNLKNGVTGIIGKNGHGKSSICDSILWILYGKFSRSTAKSNILNTYTEGSGKGELYFNIDGVKYKIVRTLTRGKQSKVFFEYLNEKNEWKTSYEVADNKRDTDKVITKYFGSYEDIIFTSIAPQDSITNVIESKRIKKDVISRFLGLDIFEECFKIANLEKNQFVNEFDIHNQDNPHHKKELYIIEINKIKQQINDIEQSIEFENNELKNLQENLELLEQKIQGIDLNKDYNAFGNEIEIINKKINDLQVKLLSIPTQKINIENEKKQYDNIDIEKNIETNEKQINILKLQKISKNDLFSNKDLELRKTHKEKIENIRLKSNDIFSKIIDEIKLLETEIEIKTTSCNLLNSDINLNKIQLQNKNVQIKLIDKAYCKGIGEYGNCEFIKNSLKAKDDVDLLSKKTDEITEEFNKIFNEKETLKLEKKQKEQDLEILKKHLEDKIKVEEQEIEKNISSYRTEFLSHVNQLETQIDNLQTDIKKQITIQNLLKELDHKKEILNLEEKNYTSELLSLTEKKSNLNIEFEKYKQIIPIIEQIKIQKQKISDKINKIENLKEQKNEFKNELTRYDTFISIADEKINRLNDLQNIINTYKKYLDAYSQDGISYQLFQKTIPKLENNINKIIFDLVGFKIKLYVDEEDKEIYIFKYYEDINHKISVDFCSGMEKFIISLALRLSYFEMNSLCKLNLFLIDEGMSVLDSENIINIKNIFNYLKTKFDKVLIISHLDTVKDYYDNIVEVIKESHQSKILY